MPLLTQQMALVPIYSSMSTKYENPPALQTTKLGARDIASTHTTVQMASRYYGAVCDDRKSDLLHHATFQNFRKLRKGAGVFSTICKKTGTETPCQIANGSSLHKQAVYASESSSIKKHMEALNSYFGKLQNNSHNKQTSFEHLRDSNTALQVEQFPSGTTELSDGSFDTKKELVSLENYLGKHNSTKSQVNNSSFDINITEDSPTGARNDMKDDYDRDEANGRNIYLQSQSKACRRISQSLPKDETSDLYLVCILASINIGVFLFEIASPVKNSDLELTTLPWLYGAKINQLILDGEWWRLVTPMFLHCGIFHVALGSWVLLTFGPQVCKGYGSFTFLLLYILGGISGNLTSYIHTPEPTVGGTGPVFAIIGAWIIHQIQNKEVAQKDILDSMYQKAIIATALSFALSNFGPIDNWTHLGATCVGIAYGYLNCPALQLDNSSPKTDQKDQLALIRQYAGPCKSIATFVIFLGIMSSLLLSVEPQVNNIL